MLSIVVSYWFVKMVSDAKCVCTSKLFFAFRRYSILRS